MGIGGCSPAVKLPEYVGDHWPNLVPRFGTDQFLHSPTYFHGVYRNTPTLFCEFLGFRSDASEGSVLLGYDLEPSDAWWWDHYVVSNRRATGNPVTRRHFTVERKHQSTLCWFATAFIWRKCKRSFFRISSCHSQRHTPSSAEVVGSHALLLRGFISSQFRSASLSREPPERPQLRTHYPNCVIKTCHKLLPHNHGTRRNAFVGYKRKCFMNPSG